MIPTMDLEVLNRKRKSFSTHEMYQAAKNREKARVIGSLALRKMSDSTPNQAVKKEKYTADNNGGVDIVYPLD